MTTGFLDRHVIVDGATSSYVLYVPPGYTGEPTPTILFLHGMGESGTDGMQQVSVGIGQAILANRARWPFLVIFPQKAGSELWPARTPMLEAILADVETNFASDPRRRYLTGLSQGGNGAFELAMHLPWRFAAIAPICGWASPTFAEELASVPIWAFHGGKDNVVPPDRSESIVGAIRAAGGNPRLTIFPDADHNSWDKAYGAPELPHWFLGHSLEL